MEKKFGKLARILLTILTTLVFLFSAGTVFPWLPYIGSVANIVTVGFLHLWLPLCVVLFLLSLTAVFAAGKKKKVALALSFSACSLICTIVFLCGNAAAVRQFGVRPNVFLRKEDVSFVRTETYPYMRSEFSELELNVYTADDGETGRPIMVYIHGGGWIQGTKDSHSYYSKVFAKHGYVVFSVEYDLSTEERHLADSTELQIAEALAWIKNHAADFGGDSSRIFLTGGSAGGNLAIELGYKINGGVYRTSTDGTELPKIKAVSVTFPVASLESFYQNTDPVLGPMAHRMASCYTGCSPEDNPELYESLAPISSITPDAPPTCMFVGAADSLVPPEATYELRDALEAAGITSQMIVVPYGNHMFDIADGNMMNCAYLELSMRWFEQYF